MVKPQRAPPVPLPRPRPGDRLGERPGRRVLDDHAEWSAGPARPPSGATSSGGQLTAAVSDGGVARPTSAPRRARPRSQASPARRGCRSGPSWSPAGRPVAAPSSPWHRGDRARRPGSSTAATTTTAPHLRPGPTTVGARACRPSPSHPWSSPDGGGQTGMISVFELEVGGLHQHAVRADGDGRALQRAPTTSRCARAFDVPGGPPPPTPRRLHHRHRGHRLPGRPVH